MGKKGTGRHNRRPRGPHAPGGARHVGPAQARRAQLFCKKNFPAHSGYSPSSSSSTQRAFLSASISASRRATRSSYVIPVSTQAGRSFSRVSSDASRSSWVSLRSFRFETRLLLVSSRSLFVCFSPVSFVAIETLVSWLYFA